ncbi:trypsin-like serine protease [Micromonospora inositola]|nr:trypsin-like serine protease [Micromonospora inositola]
MIIAGLAVAGTLAGGLVTLAARAEDDRGPATTPAAVAGDATGTDSPARARTGLGGRSAPADGAAPAQPDPAGAKAGGGSIGNLADLAPASVAYLTGRYRISPTEAARRLALQELSAPLATRLAGQFPAQYGGMWLDQTAGGVLTIGATDAAPLRTAVAGVPDAAHVRVAPVRNSLARLTAAATRLAGTLGGVAGTDVVVDQRANEVVVLTGDRIDGQDARLADALSAAGVPARAQARVAGASIEKACDPRYCAQAPMRGGIRLDVPRDDGTVGGCTTGFNVVGKGGVSYVLTAGHCVVGGRHQHVDRTWHQYLGPKVRVGVESTAPVLAENAYPTDYAIMPYQTGVIDRWAYPLRKTGPVPSLVNYWCVKDNPRCTSSRDIAITGYVPVADIQVGWVVCATGSAYTPAPGEVYVDSGAGAGYVPGTRCGEITGKTSGGIDVRICARPGDSGGPLFTEAGGKALGILSNGDPGTGPCTNPDEHNSYAPVSTILDRANAVTGGTRGLQLATRGPLLVRTRP